jgi:hypothetical protein
LFSIHTHAFEFKISKISPHTKLWYVMINIDVISKHPKTYDVTKNYGVPWKFVTPCCQMACHVIITWKTKSLLITKDNNIFN